jgi:radical SAM superfamily enzyme YgiQ (UPF0313 family)
LVRLKNPGLRIVSPPLGIGYLLKALNRMEGINPVFIDCHLDNIDERTLIQRVRKLDPVLLGIQVFSIDYFNFSRLLPDLRKVLPDTILVAGGPHVTALPEYTLRSNPDIDFVICGEGEIALPKLVKKLLDRGLASEFSDIPNLAYRKDGKYVRNKTEWIDIDELGNPDWDLIRPQDYPAVQHGTFHKSSRVVPIITSRGCPYPCTFCAGSLITGKKIRTRDIKDVVDEIEFLKTRHGFEEFIIEDENFTYYKERVISFADEVIKRGIQCYFSFPSGLRLDRLDEDIVRKLHAMGTYMVSLGVESIAPDTLKRMNKKWSREQVVSKIKLLRKYGIITQANFILGFRDDTLSDIQESIDFSLELDINQAFFGNYIPLPGTEDFNILINKKEIVLEDINWSDYTSFYGKFPYHPKGVTLKQLESMIKKATMRFYLRPRIIFNFLKRITRLIFLKSLISRIIRLFFNKKLTISKHGGGVQRR